MRRPSGLVAVFGCAAAFASAGCAANSGTTPASGSAAPSQAQTGAPTGLGWIHAGKIVFRVPRYMSIWSSRPALSSGFLFPYLGGPVLTVPKMYLIFWGYKKYGDPDKVANLLKSYCNVIGGSAHDNIYTQYYEVVGGSTTYITNPGKQCGGFYYDNKDAVPPYPTDAQVAQEALVGVARFGYDPSGSYIVATPNGRNTTGFGTQWCSYHSATYNAGNLVSYTNLPYIPNAGSACGANVIKTKGESGADEGVTVVEGNEYGSSITDPDPGSGWYSLQYGEIGDVCGWQDVKNDRFRNKFYATGAMYSNASESCVQSYK